MRDLPIGTITFVHDHLGEETFISAWAEGRTMTAEQASSNIFRD